MEGRRLETLVGLFVLVGIACLGYLALRLGKLELLGRRGYAIRAVFGSVEGLKRSAPVEIAGVEVGTVERIELDRYRAVVRLRIEAPIDLQEDAIASIRTKGLIGEKYVAITPGASEKLVKPGGTLRETEDAVEIEQLISQYIHGKL